ncbi:MAG: GTPase HflX [Planctomycetes bacterium]|nr:GTPase HflX [Planctomycetota bacterium]
MTKRGNNKRQSDRTADARDEADEIDEYAEGNEAETPVADRRTDDEATFEFGQQDLARAVLFLVSTRGDDDIEERFDELAGLCSTAGIDAVATLSQPREHPTPSHYLGKGKTEELAALISEVDARVAVCDEELSPVQGRNLEKALGVRVLDRSELILSIFASRARSKQARLQVELAQRQYQLPRLRRLWTHLDRERGGTGALGGMGEKQIDVDRRLLQERITSLRRRLDEIEERKRREIKTRKNEFLVSLVGYTNAGKSTLMNALTGAGVLEENRLFSTLDTRTRRWELGEGRHVLLSDTVGFIRDIPHKLVRSFHATLAEALESDLLLVVTDASDPCCQERVDTVRGVLDEIGAQGKDMLLVFNKIDALEDRGELAILRSRFDESLAVSARSREGIDALVSAVRSRLDAASRHVTLVVPHRLASLHQPIREQVSVLSVDWRDDAAHFEVLASPSVLEHLVAKGIGVLDDSSSEASSD